MRAATIQPKKCNIHKKTQTHNLVLTHLSDTQPLHKTEFWRAALANVLRRDYTYATNAIVFTLKALPLYFGCCLLQFNTIHPCNTFIIQKRTISRRFSQLSARSG